MSAKKFLLTALICLTLLTNIAHAKGIFKDDEGFSYIINSNYLIFAVAPLLLDLVLVYDISSIHILADNNSRFEFNVLYLSIQPSDEAILDKTVVNIREDYSTGGIYRNGELMSNREVWGKTQKEIYYKLKSAALSK